jgi:hypothetical protein
MTTEKFSRQLHSASPVTGFIRLARTRKLHYAASVVSGTFPPARYRLFQFQFKFFSVKDDV